jgi:hypothetical protein
MWREDKTFSGEGDSANVKIGSEYIQPKDFFPFSKERTWTYEIELNDMYPMYARYERWKLKEDDPETIYSVRGYFPNSIDRKQKKYRLKIAVANIAQESVQGGYVQVVYLNVLEDELGMFDYATNIAWVFSDVNASRFSVQEIAECNPNAFSAPEGIRSRMYGQSKKLLFFGDIPGTYVPSQEYGGRNSEILTCVNLENHSPDRDIKSLHFRRIIPYDKSMGKEKYAYEFFEDSWYAKGLGLVYFSQTIGDSVSLVGRLVEW